MGGLRPGGDGNISDQLGVRKKFSKRQLKADRHFRVIQITGAREAHRNLQG